LATAAAQLAFKQVYAKSGTAGDESEERWSGWLMEQPGGVFFMALAGVTLFVVAAAQAIKAYKARFDELDGDVPTPTYVRWIGPLGCAARGLIFALCGWFLISAALSHDAERAGGLGEALRHLRAQDGSGIILGCVAVGLALFGVLGMIEARYRHMRVKKSGFLRYHPAFLTQLYYRQTAQARMPT
jgi:hypothetical protein